MKISIRSCCCGALLGVRPHTSSLTILNLSQLLEHAKLFHISKSLFKLFVPPGMSSFWPHSLGEYQSVCQHLVIVFSDSIIGIYHFFLLSQHTDYERLSDSSLYSYHWYIIEAQPL